MHLRLKILYGFLGMFFLIGSMVVILLVEHQKICDIEKETKELRDIRKNINSVHRKITELATLGETVISWSDVNYHEYHTLQMETDSLLEGLKLRCENFLQVERIDSLREILAYKDYHLHVLMDFISRQENVDSMLVNRLSAYTRQNLNIRTVTRRKKGIAGLFGQTEKINVFTPDIRMEKQNDRLIERLNNHKNNVELYADSMRIHNKELNDKLSSVIRLLDVQAESSFFRREEKICKAQANSLQLFFIVFMLSVMLLIISFFLISRDIKLDEKKKLKIKEIIKENEILLEMRKKVILTVSHDIRGPLGNIHNCADLASETRDKKKREAYLKDIRHSCNHVLHLVNNLMDAYRINEARDLRNDAPFHLGRFLQRISDEFSRKANMKALIFYYTHMDSDLTVKGDADKIERVLANLLSNAIKFTLSGSIHFQSEYSGSELRVEIRDTGIGMDEETLKRIFAPFERAAQNINSEGFGLGLFLAKGLVNMLDGTLEVKSDLGKGSVFRLMFPLPESDDAEEEAVVSPYPESALPQNVLVLDDDPIQLKIAEDMLGRKGILCKTCTNVREVVEAIGQSDYDIVLTDVQMPGIDGFGLLKLLRNSDIGNSRTVPVAVMTARGDGGSGVYEKEGFAGCIHKPFNIHGLLKFLSSVMSRAKGDVSGEFDFSRLLENTEDNGYILSLVVDESRSEIDELRSALEDCDRDSMRKTIHKMMPVWEMFGKVSLLRGFQEVLHDSGRKDEIVCSHAIQIIEQIGILIEETEKQLGKYENTDN